LRAIPALVQVEGELDLPAYRAAVAELTGAHDALRTVFRADDPTTVTVRAEGDEPAVRYVDARDAPDVWAEVHRDLTDPFPLDCPRRIRTVVAMVGADTHLLGLAADHVALDGLSLGLLARDLLGRYAETRRGRSRPGTTAAPYAEFARRQRVLLAGTWGAERRDYWFRTFDRWGPHQPGSPLAVRAEPDAGPTAGRSMIMRATLGPQSTDALEQTARRHHTTRFAVLAAAVSRAQLVASDAATAGVVADFHGRVLPPFWRTLGLFSHGIRIFLDRAESTELSTAVRVVAERLAETHRFGLPLRPLTAEWLAQHGERSRYGEPHYVYLGVRPRLDRYLDAGTDLRVTPVDAGRLSSPAGGHLWLNLAGTAEHPVLEGGFNDRVFGVATVEELVRAAFGALGPAADLEIVTTPSATAPLPAPEPVAR
jgi:hypothetical protein